MNEAMSRPALIRQFFAGSAAFLALPVSAIITGPILARALGPEGRGIMAALLVPVSLANLMLTMGLPESINWHIARGRISHLDAVRLALVGGVVSGVLGSAALVFIGPWLLKGDARTYLFQYDLLAITLPVTLSIAALRGIVYGGQGFRFINTEQFVGVGLRLAVLIGLFVFGLLNPTLAVWTTVLSGIFASASLIPALLRTTEQTATTVRVTEVLRYARSTALGTIGGFLIMRIDQFLMTPIAGAEQLGYYAVAVSLAELPIAAARVVAKLIFNSGRDTSQFAPQACRLSLLVLLPACGAAILLAPYVLPLIFGENYAPAVPMAQVLFISISANVVEYLLSTGLNSIGYPGRNSLLQVCGAVLSVLLIALLVPRYGGLGAAWATTVAYIVQAFATILVFCKATGVMFSDCVWPSRREILTLYSTHSIFPRKVREGASKL